MEGVEMNRLPVQYPDLALRRRVPSGARSLSQAIVNWLWVTLFATSSAALVVHILA
jgi:hypothetical protein